MRPLQLQNHGSDGLEAGLEPAALAAFRQGDRRAFRRLVEPELGRLRAFARRLSGRVDAADDLVQEVLLRAFRSCHTFRGEGSMRSWLFRIAARIGSEPHRYLGRDSLPPPDPTARKVESVAPESLESGELGPGSTDADSGWSPLAAARESEVGARLEVAMDELPERQRVALHLRASEGLDYQRIGGVLGCSNGAARMLVLEARKALLRRLPKEWLS